MSGGGEHVVYMCLFLNFCCKAVGGPPKLLHDVSPRCCCLERNTFQRIAAKICVDFFFFFAVTSYADNRALAELPETISNMSVRDVFGFTYIAVTQSGCQPKPEFVSFQFQIFVQISLLK